MGNKPLRIEKVYQKMRPKKVSKRFLEIVVIPKYHSLRIWK